MSGVCTRELCPVVLLATCVLSHSSELQAPDYSPGCSPESPSRVDCNPPSCLPTFLRVCVSSLAARILQPQYAFINLNPFEVLQLHHTATDEEIKVRYRKVRCLSVGRW